MNDQELLGVIGHEIGHVKHAHTMGAMHRLHGIGWPQAMAAPRVAQRPLADSDLERAGRKELLNSQFSQSQETESDDYGPAFMQKHKYNVKAMEGAFRKLASLGGKRGGMDQMLSSHPDPGARADRYCVTRLLATSKPAARKPQPALRGYLMAQCQHTACRGRGCAVSRATGRLWLACCRRC